MGYLKDYSKMYEDLGIDSGERGCIMLDTEPVIISDTVLPEDLYYSEDSDSFVQGNVSESVPHVTLLYGLMQTGPEVKKHVDFLLSDIKIDSLTVDKVDFFYGKDSEYVTIIALVRVTDELVYANNELKRLPHINTFPGYKPHVTLAYVRNDAAWTDIVARLNDRLAGLEIKTTQINYGR